MDGVTVPRKLGKAEAVSGSAIVDFDNEAIFRGRRLSAVTETLAKYIPVLQLGLSAAVVLGIFLPAEQIGKLSAGQLIHGIVVLCGFAILVNYWSRRRQNAVPGTAIVLLMERAAQIAALLLIATILAIDLTGVSWEYLRPGLTFVLLLAIGGSDIVALALVNWLSRDPKIRCVVVFGDGEQAFQLAQQVRAEMSRTKVCLYPIGQLAAPKELSDSALDTPFHADPKLVELAPDVAIVSAEACDGPAIARMTAHLAPLPIDVLVHAPHRGPLGFGPMVTVAGMPFIRVFPKPLKAYQRGLKRAFDIIASLALVGLLLPLLVSVGLMIKLTSRGPVLFRQPRVGLGGSHFTVYKFRTMHAEVADLLAEKPTINNDPRLTAVGAFLRRSSIDELPQLLNVLLGSMSLVGPRPHAMNGNGFGRLVGNYHARHRVRPGITGLAQVLGWRGPTDTRAKIEQRVANDLRYISHWSLGQDLLIIGRTIFSMWGKNAF
jgi:exopolysaccharide biosynthesis polyprenyl glycosylphosphotransferase